MLMPKASVNKYDCLIAWKNDVGAAGQVTAMEAEAVAEMMKE